MKFGVNVSLICLCTWNVRWYLYKKKIVEGVACRLELGFKVHIIWDNVVPIEHTFLWTILKNISKNIIQC